MNNKTTFWNYIKDNVIEIPIIQRDYAQGRLGKENLRKSFLADLKKALDNESPYKNTAMKLDFVYGSTESGKLNPLDGQQRLTTLWLLHWYIALRAGELNEGNCTVFRKFTYETRISSREFCQNLCIPENFENFDGNDIVGFITKQTWFYSAWKQDPTIQSMLRMLGGTKVADKKGVDIVDGIEELFEETDTDIFEKYWVKLTADNAPIVFYHLPLKDFGLSDDLYIKMNARGKQLTSFENFKADLIGYITKQSEDETLDEDKRVEWKKLLDPMSGIPIKLDTDWTDIFWRNKSNDNRIDEIYFAFLNRFFWNELFIAKDKADKYILDIGKGDENSTQENNNSSYKYLNNSDHPNDYDTTIAYEGLDSYRYYEGTIPLSFFQKLAKVLNEYLKYSENNSLPGCSWDTSFRFIPQYVVENSNNIEISNNANEKTLKFTTLNQVQRVVFFSVSKYFNDSGTGQDTEVSLKQWMRVVWNLVSGEDHNGRPQIRSTQAMRTAIKFINELNSHDVYSSLSNYELQKLSNSDFDERCKEEIAKAKQILDENGDLRKYNGSCKKEDGTSYHTWEEIIIKAESYAFFKGSIRFLFTNENGDVNDQSWQDFDTKWTNAQHFFNNGIVVPTIRIAEYFNDKQISDIFSRYSFKTENWKSILLQKSISKPIHQFLLGKTVNNTSVLYTDIKNILESINTQDVWLLQDWQHCEIVLTNYSTRRSEPYKGYVFQVGNEVRNKWNNVISKISEIEVRVPPAWGDEKIEINGLVYYRGLWTDMMYKDHLFRYFGNNTVCLMTADGACIILKNDKEMDKPENTYYFEVTEDFFNNNKNIFEHLEHLITQADTDKQTL